MSNEDELPVTVKTLAQALMRCQRAQRARGDYVSHSVYWVT